MKFKYKEAFMDMAERFGQASEAQRLKVGALLVKHNSIISQGCNGTPAGFYTNVCEDENWNTKPEVHHAEINALNKLRKTHDTSVGATLFVSHMPCYFCALELVDAGVEEVYYRHSYRKAEGVEYLRSHGVKVYQI